MTARQALFQSPGRLKDHMKILFLTEEPADGMSPATRFRIINFLPYFENMGIQCTLSVSKPPKYILGRIRWRKLFNKSVAHKLVLVTTVTLMMTISRLYDLWRCRRYDIVLIQRDLLFVPTYPFLERLFCLIHPAVVFDFDDAIFTLQSSKKFEGIQGALIRAMTRMTGGKNKIRNIIKWSDHVIAANRYLHDYAVTVTDRVTIIPTPIDMAAYPLKKFRQRERIVIGWSGQQANLPYLMELKPVLEALGKKYSHITLKIICNPTLYDIQFDHIPFEFHTWNLETEIEDLQDIDVGLMPLPEDEWTKGKCSLKLLQYMALGIASVGTDFGYNREVILEGENGFLADREVAWVEKLSLLIEDFELRKSVGLKARETVAADYSIAANMDNFVKVFNRVASS